MRAIGLRGAAYLGAMMLCLISVDKTLAQIEPIVLQEARDHPGCLIYLKSDGSRLRYKGSPITPYGPCPKEFVRGLVTRYGPQTYKLEMSGTTCVMYPNGYGRCQ